MIEVKNNEYIDLFFKEAKCLSKEFGFAARMLKVPWQRVKDRGEK